MGWWGCQEQRGQHRPGEAGVREKMGGQNSLGLDHTGPGGQK